MRKTPKPDHTGRGEPPRPTTEPKIGHLVLGLVCFCAGAALMVIEITGNRLLAPLFGNSIYTWTALIGVVLIAFSIGAYLGGRLADLRADNAVLAVLLFGAAMLVVAIPSLATLLEEVSDGVGVITGPLLFSLGLFTLPGVLLGAVSPFSMRLYSLLSADTHVGLSAGVISMLGSLGSVAGTFAAGFYLLSSIGVSRIFFGTGVALLALGGLVLWLDGQWHSRRFVLVLLGFFAVFSSALLVHSEPKQGTIYAKDTFYHRIRVFEGDLRGRPARLLLLDNKKQGGFFRDGDELPLPYQNVYRLLQEVRGYKLKDALFIGAGAFAMPQRVSDVWRDAEVDVVEIDPAVIQVGYDYFNLGAYPKIRTHAMDGRRFLRRTAKRYDLIFGDAYDGLRHIPPHLATREFFALASSKLRPGGMYMMNTISALQGEKGELLQVMVATLATVFEDIRIIGMAPHTPERTQNIVILAGESLGLFFKGHTRRNTVAGWLRAVGSKPQALGTEKSTVLTDDLNNIEWVIARQLVQGISNL